jgi:4-hydroxy-4-methyl-2-oxoglutarate aldolase
VNDLILDRLRRLDACAVSDASDALGLNAVALGLRRLSTDQQVVGRAVTVQLGVAEAGPTARRHLGTAAVEASGPGDVLVIANEGRESVAGWGGNLSLAAAARAISGVIIDGACRDLAQTQQAGLPLFGRTAVPVTARGRIVELEWNSRVEICGVVVEPGDLVVADADGVVFISARRADEIVALAESIVAKEARMAQDIGRGVAVSTVMGTNYEQMLENS